MLRTLVICAGIVIGMFFFAVAGIYFSLSADNLPTLMPGYDPDVHKIHVTHGVGFLVMGILSFAMAGLRAVGD